MTSSVQPAVRLTEDEITEIFLPYAPRELQDDDPEWIDECNRLKRIEFRRYWKDMLLHSWRRSGKKFKASVEATYEHVWETTPPEIQLLPTHNLLPVFWQGKNYFAQAKGCSRVHLAVMADLIKQIRPKRVLEIGAGSGQNLFWLSAMFPDIEFEGVELTEAGVRQCHRVRSLDSLPSAFDNYLLLPPIDSSSHQRIKVWQGNAASVDKEDNSYDLVFSRLALEQMEMIRNKVLAEMFRLSSKYVMMVEPFKNWNDKGIRLHHNSGSHYFQAYVEDLPKIGLRPILQFSDWPYKLVQKPALSLCEVNG